MSRVPTNKPTRPYVRRLLPLVCAGLSWAGSAGAASPTVRALSTGERMELLAAVDGHFGVAGVGPSDGLTLHDHEGTCLTGVVETLRLHWSEFTDSERAELTDRLAPWKEDLFAPRAPPPAEGGLPAPPVTCFGHYLENWEDGDHFSVQYEDGAITAAEARDFLDWLEYSYDRQIGELGWREPLGISSYPMLVMVVAGGGASAYTTVEEVAKAWPRARSQPLVCCFRGSRRRSAISSGP